MIWNYGLVERENGEFVIAELFFNEEEQIIACIEVNITITNSLHSDPFKAHIEEINSNYFKEVDNKYIRQSTINKKTTF